MSIISESPIIRGAVAEHAVNGVVHVPYATNREERLSHINALLRGALTTLLVAVVGTLIAGRHVRNLTDIPLIQSTFSFLSITAMALGELSVTAGVSYFSLRLSLGVRLTD